MKLLAALLCTVSLAAQDDLEKLGQAGMRLLSAGEYSKALDTFHKVLDSARAAGDREMEASMLDWMGVAYITLGSIQQSLEMYLKELAITPVGSIRPPLSQIAYDYYSLGDFDQALGYYQRALAGA